MIERMVRAATGENQCVLEEFLPCPQALVDAESPNRSSNAQQLKETYGFDNWYDWRVANWGTKWDLCEVMVEQHDANNITLTFDTAWAPATAAYAKLSLQGFIIEAYYYEPGMQFAGIWNDDEDTYFKGWGNSEGAKELLPRELDEMFAISETQAEWEEEDA